MGQELLDVRVGGDPGVWDLGGRDGCDDVYVLLRERLERGGYEPAVVLELR